jgi:hypothetical protein
MGPSLLNEPNDIQWLRDVHLTGYSTPDFKSFVLHGQEDCPERIELYADRDPLVTDAPVATFVLYEDEGEYKYVRKSC